MGYPSAEQVAQRAHDIGLLDERQLREVWATLGSRNVPLDDLLQLLVRREYMTNYQVERLVKGDRSGFFYGPYKVLYLVGTGTFARCFAPSTARPAPSWRSRRCGPATATTRRSTASFSAKAASAARLRHPNIVPIFDVVSQGKHHFLVMEFVEGWSLQNFVKIRKKVEPREAVKLMIEMTEGLRYAFEHGLTHRDLKLNNVLVSSAGQAKLVDFGLAAIDDVLADDALADLPNTRTIDYAALERATGVRKDDTRSDIYFLGCIFYHMLTGQAPLSETKDRLQRLSKQRFLEVIPVQNVDPFAAALGDAGGQQGDDARPQPSLSVALGALGRLAPRRSNWLRGTFPRKRRPRRPPGACRKSRKAGQRHGRRVRISACRTSSAMRSSGRATACW